MMWEAIAFQNVPAVDLLAAPGVKWPDDAQVARDALRRYVPDAAELGMHGFFYTRNGDYHAGVELDPTDPDLDDALRPDAIPGGWYAKVRVDDWPGRIGQIPSIFDRTQTELEAIGRQIDASRPFREHYHPLGRLVLMLPIVDPSARFLGFTHE